ncbi:MAG TPA: hypothetical protein VFO11_04145, partial [Candidatus Polarisedimenticolaceae bacterium]|nr:hypothetical protein [Candidatus Polarisedimenticolaceae bacterium]
MRRRAAIAALAALTAGGAAAAAVLPPHRPLRILVVSDTVNPHGLSSADLTEGLNPGPGDIGNTLRRAGTGVVLDAAADAVREIPTNDIEQATALLGLPPCDAGSYDVLVYFSHRIPDPDAGKPQTPQQRQDAFTTAVEAFLGSGGGLVSFHHGAYAATGKAGILELIGATASGAVPWDTVAGQNVIDVAPGHFVTTHGITYTGSVGYSDPGRGVAPGTYPYFNNTPDERYPVFSINPTAALFATLFGSNYSDAGTAHLLGFTHRRPAWSGIVVGYQPAEYQPHALDDLGGPNFQILANAILFAADARRRNDLQLTVAPGVAPGAVDLSWTAGQGNYTVFRSSDPAAVTDRCGRLGTTSMTAWSDVPPPAGIVYYQVAG